MLRKTCDTRRQEEPKAVRRGMQRISTRETGSLVVIDVVVKTTPQISVSIITTSNLTGHLQKVCRKKSKALSIQEKSCPPQSSGCQRGGRVRTILLIFEHPLSHYSNNDSNGAKLSMQVDTGALLSLISEETYVHYG